MVAALIKFTQGLTVGGDGQALIGSVGTTVTVNNVDNSDVEEWWIDLLYVEPNSALGPITPGIPVNLGHALSSTPLANFDPDIPGSYRIRTLVRDVVGNTDTDIRVFSVPLANGAILPPYQDDPRPLPSVASGLPGAKPNEMNFDGQFYGWSGDLNLSRKLLNQQIRDVDASLNKVKVNSSDTTADYLNNKLIPGEGFRKTIINPGSTESLQVDLPDKTEHEPSAALEMVPALRGLNLWGACFDGAYIWAGAGETSTTDEYGRSVITKGGWIRFSKTLNYIERDLYATGNNTHTAALAYDADRSRVLEVRIYDVMGTPTAWIITHTLTTPSVAGTPVALPTPGSPSGIRVFPAGPYIFVIGIPGGTLRLDATDLSIQSVSAIAGEFFTGQLLYDPTDRYGDGEGRVFTKLGTAGYGRWIPSTGVQDGFGQPGGSVEYGIMLGINPISGRIWAIWGTGGVAVQVGSFDCEVFGANPRSILPTTWVATLAISQVIGGAVDGGLAYLVAPKPAWYQAYAMQSFSDSGVAISEEDFVEDDTLYGAKFNITNNRPLSNPLLLDPGVALHVITYASNRIGETYTARILPLSPVGAFLDDDATEIGWAAAVKPAGDLQGDPRHPLVAGLWGKRLDPFPAPGTVHIVPPDLDWSYRSGYIPYTSVVGTGTAPAFTLSSPHTGFLVGRTNNADPLTLNLLGTYSPLLTSPVTIHIQDVLGNIGQLGSHVTVQAYTGQTIRLAENTPVQTLMMRSAYEELVLVQNGTGWQVTERNRHWEGIDIDANIEVKSSYALCKVDSSGGAITVTLLASPQHDDWCIIKDVVGDADTYNITVDGNGETIDGQASKIIAVAYGHLQLRYDAIANEWIIIEEKTTPVLINSLVINHSLSSGTNNDVNPTNWAGAGIARFDSPAAADITGLAAILATDVLQRKLYNVGSYNITLKYQNAGSISANRLIIPGYADLIIAPDDVVDLFYDIITARWRVG